MAGREVIEKNQALLREIIRTISKRLDYTVTEVGDARFTLKLTLRNREATVSVSLEDLSLAEEDTVRRNAVRQKIKNVHDRMMHTPVLDVLGKKVARMLKASAGSQEIFQRRSPFQRGGPRR